MRTTLNLDDGLLTQAKQSAAATGRTLTAVIEDALRESLARPSRAAGGTSLRDLPTFAGTGLQPGVDLDDTSALLDLMDEPPRDRS